MSNYLPSVVLNAFLMTSALLSADDWQPADGLDKSIFPSLAIATASIDTTNLHKTKVNEIGDTLGQLGVYIKADQDNETFSVEISSPNFIQESTLNGVLPQAGMVYKVYPKLNYDYDALYRVVEPIPEVISYHVTVNGADLGTKRQTVEVRSLSDCPLGIKHKDGTFIPMYWMAAAYVDENSPIVDKVLQRALQLKLTPAFTGYQGGTQSLYSQMFAVWNVLQRQGVKYSNITTPSVESSKVLSQHIRSISDSITDTQANCIDGSVLFASIYRKIGLRAFLVLVPGHCYTGVFLDPQGKDLAVLETTRIGAVDLKQLSLDRGINSLLSGRPNNLSQTSFHNACLIGINEFRAALPHIQAHDPGYLFIDLDKARAMGIQPLRSQ